MSLLRCCASAVLFVLCVGFSWSQEPGGCAPPQALNGVKFDVPAVGKLNPDSPEETVVTAKGTITTAAGWTCTKYEFTIKEGLHWQTHEWQIPQRISHGVFQGNRH